MRIGRTLPPSAPPIRMRNILAGIRALFCSKEEIFRFESELKKYFNVEHVFLLSSGKAALTVILKAIHALNPEKNEVLIPAFTCFSVPSAIIKAGLKVRLCDAGENSLDFEHKQFESIVNGDKVPVDKLLAVIPTHLYGYPSNIGKIKESIDQKEIVVIEDAAQAMGSDVDGAKCGTLGDVGFFSLSRGKAITAIEGGIIITNNGRIAAEIEKVMADVDGYSVKSICTLIIYSIVLILFSHPTMFWIPKSLPFLGLGRTVFDPDFEIMKMSSYQAGFASGWEKRLAIVRQIRRRLFEKYKKRIKQKTGSASGLYDDEKNMTKTVTPIRLPVRIKNKQNRDRILMESEKHGFGIMGAYPEAISQLKIPVSYLDSYQYRISEMHVKEMITLPLHEYVTDQDVVNISGCL